jgi:hypothetical protein
LKVEKFIKWASVVWIINFAVFVIVSLFIVGDAISGHSAGGHYFLNEKGHLTEVSRAVFIYSEWHALSVFPLPILLIASFALKNANRDRPRRKDRY